eukprot:1639546-Amphidinium_carterae.1
MSRVRPCSWRCEDKALCVATEPIHQQQVKMTLTLWSEADVLTPGVFQSMSAQLVSGTAFEHRSPTELLFWVDQGHLISEQR